MGSRTFEFTSLDKIGNSHVIYAKDNSSPRTLYIIGQKHRRVDGWESDCSRINAECYITYCKLGLESVFGETMMNGRDYTQDNRTSYLERKCVVPDTLDEVMNLIEKSYQTNFNINPESLFSFSHNLPLLGTEDELSYRNQMSIQISRRNPNSTLQIGDHAIQTQSLSSKEKVYGLSYFSFERSAHILSNIENLSYDVMAQGIGRLHIPEIIKLSQGQVILPEFQVGEIVIPPKILAPKFNYNFVILMPDSLMSQPFVRPWILDES